MQKFLTFCCSAEYNSLYILQWVQVDPFLHFHQHKLLYAKIRRHQNLLYSTFPLLLSPHPHNSRFLSTFIQRHY
ncbi:hypothetical protein L2E82_13519 [Cichorium intybus]|uniref:Uncharacterized protein n=1 Tax=Cichorium intybus TaxID=13427 RepID=A0ACB9EXK1_CICIN|nr:hypothetical protein L2E82_13519 [Cichorium intybus]